MPTPEYKPVGVFHSVAYPSDSKGIFKGRGLFVPQFPRRSVRKTQVEECLSLDARVLLRRRAGWLSGGSGLLSWQLPYPSGMASAHLRFGGSDASTLILRYGFDRHTYWPKTELKDGDGAQVEYSIATDATPQKLGGSRLWFLCPLVISGRACERRVRVLYLPQTAQYFGCRHCYGLVYRSSQESKTKLEAVRKKFAPG